MTNDPFTPKGPLPPELLQRYLRGELDAAERHRVELHFENDPLLQEAVDGLSMPGAAEAFSTLHPPPAVGTSNGRAMLGGVLLVAIVAATWWWARSADMPAAVVVAVNTVREQPLATRGMDSMLSVVHGELDRAVPPALVPAHPATESFVRAVPAEIPPVVRDTLVRIAPVDPVMQLHRADPVLDVLPEPKATLRPSRQLVFLHDLKLVHPDELYPASDPRRLAHGVAADASGSRSAITTDPLFEKGVPTGKAYLGYMDEVLGAFVQGRTAVALDDLLFLLNQYPDDVNAQFYAGLSCFRSGLYGRAKGFFAKAERNSVDSFQEEAAWYGARTTQELEGLAAARPAYEKIVEAKGFYAQQAAERLR